MKAIEKTSDENILRTEGLEVDTDMKQDIVNL